jgi:molybdopterin-binding protein
VVIPADEIEICPLAGTTATHGNTLQGRVRSLQMQSVCASVEVEVVANGTTSAPPVLTAYLLQPQVERLGLATGLRVLLQIPWTAVHVCLDAGRSPDGGGEPGAPARPEASQR